ncbi:MAG: ATP-binding protein [Chloroflexi bacterium]|nr:ATP-binding protein [Chloroflexota bacterium]
MGALLVLAGVAAAAVTLLPETLDWGVVVIAVLLAGILVTRRADAAPPRSVTAPPIDFVGELRALLALLPEGILVVDADENVLVANPAIARILRRPPEAMEGVTLIRATRDAALAQVLREASGEPRDVALSDDRLVRAAATRLGGMPVHAVLTVQDVTALRNAERARSELVANVSHELRTPIAAARALAETLEAGVDEPEQRERFHARLTRELERLGEIVERLLRLSRLESRAEEFDIQPIPVSELIRVALTRVRPVADRAQVTLVVEEEVPGGGGEVLADRERALEVLTNLLDNALRYSPAEGTITILVGPAGHVVQICVRDQGPGILPTDRQRIFERFYTADRARTGGAGTGLGLAIARHIVSRLGGEIWVADTTPGASICFTLPRGTTPV